MNCKERCKFILIFHIIQHLQKGLLLVDHCMLIRSGISLPSASRYALQRLDSCRLLVDMILYLHMMSIYLLYVSKRRSKGLILYLGVRKIHWLVCFHRMWSKYFCYIHTGPAWFLGKHPLTIMVDLKIRHWNFWGRNFQEDSRVYMDLSIFRIISFWNLLV